MVPTSGSDDQNGDMVVWIEDQFYAYHKPKPRHPMVTKCGSRLYYRPTSGQRAFRRRYRSGSVAQAESEGLKRCRKCFPPA